MTNKSRAFSRRRLLGAAAAGYIASGPVLGASGPASGGPADTPPRGSHGASERSTSSSDVAFLKPGDADYDKYRQPFAKRIQYQPAIVAVCRTERGVQQAVAEARSRGLPVALKSGGHSFEGFCVNEGGLVLDMSTLAGLSLSDGEPYTLTAGPGARLGRLYDHLAARGRWLPAGSCAGVGLGGLTLGGGYGFWSRQLGLTCDSLTRVRVVDAQGAVHDSKDEPELLWACRGGGTAGFGAVTHMELATHALPPQFSTWRFRYKNLTPEDAMELTERWFGLMSQLPRTAFSAFVLHARTLVVLVTDSSAKAPKAVLDGMRARAEAAPFTRAEPTPRAVKRYASGTAPEYFKNVSAGYYTSFQDIAGVLPRVIDSLRKGPGLLLQINTLGGAIGDADREAGAAYPHRRFPFLGELQSYYETPKREAAAHAAVREIQAMFAGAGISAHYSNYPDVGIETFATAYYGASLARLRALKGRLDPQDLFRHPQSLRPA